MGQIDAWDVQYQLVKPFLCKLSKVTKGERIFLVRYLVYVLGGGNSGLGESNIPYSMVNQGTFKSFQYHVIALWRDPAPVGR